MGEARVRKIATGGIAGLALLIFAAGCSSGSATATSLTVTMTPASVTALVGSLVQFVAVPSETVDSVTFFVNDVQGGNATIGTITSDGLYQAPAVVPANTAITVKVTVSNSSNGKSASATSTVTLDSGVRVSISGSSFTIGTSETYPFTATVAGVPATASISGVCDSVSNNPVSCNAVTWSLTGSGSIDPNTGLFTAPDSAGSATITAQSVYDSTQKASAAVTIVTASDPTISSISNTVGTVGALFQDIFLAGSNFISTTKVFFNGVPLPTSNIVVSSSSALRARIPDALLVTPGTFEVTVARQLGGPQSCSPNPCQITLSAARPAVVGSAPDSFPQGSAPTIRVNGGYFGTNANPVVTAQFGSQLAAGTVVSARELDIAAGGPDVNTPGLVPIRISSTFPGVPPTELNVAVQPSYAGSGPSLAATVAVGSQPSAVAINTATGMAVVANRGSHDISVINLATGATVFASICTGAVGSSAAPCPVASSPSGVAVDNLRNIALVANHGSSINTCTFPECSIAVVNLSTGAVTSLMATDPNPDPSPDRTQRKIPVAIGVNPVSGTAIVAYQNSSFAGIIDLTVANPSVGRIISASTSLSPRIAVSPRLNWALVTPGSNQGGTGVLSLIDLGRQNTTAIKSATCSGTGATATVTVNAPGHLLRQSDPVLITGAAGTGINGIFTVSGVSGENFTYASKNCSGSSNAGTASYGLPIATVATSVTVQGVAFNDETKKAILVDTNPVSSQAFVFSALDQTSSSAITGLAGTGNVAAAFNPFTNAAVVVNQTNGNFTVVDPTTPAAISNSTTATGTAPVDVAIDPGLNRAVIANQGDNTVSIVSLGGIRPVHVLQVARQVAAPASWAPADIVETGTLSSAPVYADETLQIIGKGFTGASAVRLDGDSTGVQIQSASDRVISVKILASRLQAGGAHRYALDVVDGSSISNAVSLPVAQAVDLTSACANAIPQSVAIDESSRNLALVTTPGCNGLAVLNLATGTGAFSSPLSVGTNPQGVAVALQPGLAVVANQDSNNASLVDLVSGTVAATVNTDPGPIGVAIDQALNKAAVTANSANTISTFTVSSTPDTAVSLPVQVRPAAVAVNPDTHIAAVANTASNSMSLVDLTQTSGTTTLSAGGLPAGVAYDPASSDFLTVQSQANQMLVLDPITRTTTAVRIGINPTSIAYNFETATLVTTNSSSQTMTVFDFLSGKVRQVVSTRASGRFAVAIHPFSNLAVIADPAGNRVLIRPLP